LLADAELAEVYEKRYIPRAAEFASSKGLLQVAAPATGIRERAFTQIEQICNCRFVSRRGLEELD
jgi:hypothetical protein